MTTDPETGHHPASLRHGDCLLCGWRDPLSLGLRFTHDGNGGLRALFRVGPELQGYDGILHGGVISALLDAAMTHCLIHRGVPALTAELKVRYLLPVPCDGELRISARILEARPPLYRISAELMRNGDVYATASASFIHRECDPAASASP